MAKLVPLTQSEYDSWHAAQLDDYAAEIERSGVPRELAQEKARTDSEQLLPGGLNSKDQYLYSVRDEDTGQKVGVLWFAPSERGERKTIFLYDILIDEEFRGRGYGTQAMTALEDRARELGAVRIGLHVFGHNERARQLYKRLGYVETNINMAKDL